MAYVVAEGRSGFPRRLQAWRAAHDVRAAGWLYVLQAPVQLMDTGEVSELIRALRELPEPVLLVIIDTLARCLVGGDENSAKDMGRFIAGIDRIRAETGAAVLVVHHTDKANRAERGSSALRGAADTLMMIERDGDRLTLSCDKQKDAEEFPGIEFGLRVIDFEDGETSCVLDPIAGGRRARAIALTASEKKALGALGVNRLTHADWMAASGLPKATFNRVRKALVQAERVTRRAERYEVAPDPDTEPREGEAVS